MGCLNAKQMFITHYFVPNGRKPGQGEQAQEDFATLQLSKIVIDRLYNAFVDMDKDKEGIVDLDEFCRYFEFERSPFVDRAFLCFDEEMDGELDFREMVVSLWNYCTLDLKSLIKFAFRLYDPDNSGYIEVTEMRQMLEEIYGAQFKYNTRLLPLLEELDVNEDGRISLTEFKTINERYPSMLFPAFRIQMTIRDTILGEQFWKEQLQLRLQNGELSNDCLFETMRIMDERKRRVDQHALKELGQNRWVPENPPDDYVPAPTLSYKGRQNHKIAQKELLIRAGILAPEEVDELQKRDAARLKEQQSQQSPVKKPKKKSKKSKPAEEAPQPSAPLIKSPPKVIERPKNRRDNLNLELKRALGAARRTKT